jgi:hypothetical protein
VWFSASRNDVETPVHHQEHRSGREAVAASEIPQSAEARVHLHITHEPGPRIPAFSSTGGEGARRVVEGDARRFNGSICEICFV